MEAGCICAHTCKTRAGPLSTLMCFCPQQTPWHIWSSDFISCMHQYSSLSHMCFPHLAPFISNPLNTSRPLMSIARFSVTLFAVLALQIMSDTCKLAPPKRRYLPKVSVLSCTQIWTEETAAPSTCWREREWAPSSLLTATRAIYMSPRH